MQKVASNRDAYKQFKTSCGSRWEELDLNEKRHLVAVSSRSAREKAAILRGILMDEHGQRHS